MALKCFTLNRILLFQFEIYSDLVMVRKIEFELLYCMGVGWKVIHLRFKVPSMLESDVQ